MGVIRGRIGDGYAGWLCSLPVAESVMQRADQTANRRLNEPTAFQFAAADVHLLALVRSVRQ